jgi:hypothetical protein
VPAAAPVPYIYAAAGQFAHRLWTVSWSNGGPTLTTHCGRWPLSAFGRAVTAIRYCEPRRILYNLALALVVVAVFITNPLASRATLTFDTLQMLFVLAVLANVAYCAAYVVDLVLQLSAFRIVWLRHRWALLLIGWYSEEFWRISSRMVCLELAHERKTLPEGRAVVARARKSRQ